VLGDSSDDSDDDGIWPYKIGRQFLAVENEPPTPFGGYYNTDSPPEYWEVEFRKMTLRKYCTSRPPLKDNGQSFTIEIAGLDLSGRKGAWVGEVRIGKTRKQWIAKYSILFSTCGKALSELSSLSCTRPTESTVTKQLRTCS
jgi:hypothetical protein